MILPQSRYAVKQEGHRALPLLPSPNSVLGSKSHGGSRIWLQDQELDGALSLQKLKQSSPPNSPMEWELVQRPLVESSSRRYQPSARLERAMVESDRGGQDSQQCSLPSFSELEASIQDRTRAYDTPQSMADRMSLRSARSSMSLRSVFSSTSLRSARSSITEDIEFTLVPYSPPASTLYESPAVSPTTPSHTFDPGYTLIQDDRERERRQHHLRIKEIRRIPSRGSIQGSDDTIYHYQQQLQQQPSAQTLRPARSNKQLRRPSSKSSLRAPPLPSQGDPEAAPRERHFNQKYSDPDKLFTMYCREDLKKAWSDIRALRLGMLPLLLGADYDRRVEENRTVNGLNASYYRENDSIPVMNEDGCGLLFKEHGGRYWECVRSQKCRSEESGESGSGGGGRKRNGSAADPRPRGMVERYPEEVLNFWDSHVKHFLRALGVSEEKVVEVYARAMKYSQYRREQREYYGVPAWALDNARDRVFHLNPKKPEKTDDNNTPSARGRASRRNNRRS